MKKLYRKGSVHPSPSPLISDPLAFLPFTILTLAAALSPEDREVLAYLISCSSSNNNNNNNSRNASAKNRATKSAAAAAGCCRDHPPSFGCNCFRCYTSYWAKWDSSPNRQLIHEIIDAFEDNLVQKTQQVVGKEMKKERRRRSSKTGVVQIQIQIQSQSHQRKVEAGKLEFIDETVRSGGDGDGDGDGCGGGEEISGGDCDLDGEEREDEVCGEKEGAVRRFVSFVGERIWNVWT